MRFRHSRGNPQSELDPVQKKENRKDAEEEEGRNSAWGTMHVNSSLHSEGCSEMREVDAVHSFACRRGVN